MTHEIEYIQITLKPWHFSDRPERIVEISLQVNGQQYKYSKVIPPSDFEAFFDQAIEVAMMYFKEAIKKGSAEIDLMPWSGLSRL